MDQPPSQFDMLDTPDDDPRRASRGASTISGSECNIAFTHAVSRRSCVNAKVRWLMFRAIQNELKTEQELIAAQWILCHCHKQLPYDRNWWSRLERQYGELCSSNPEVESQVKVLNRRLHGFVQQLVRATAAVKKYVDGIDPVTNTLRKRDWNASTSLSEWVSGDRGLLIKKLANNDPDVAHVKQFLPTCLCDDNLREALHNGGILIYCDQQFATSRVKRALTGVPPGEKCRATQGSSQLNLVRPGAADTRMLDITLMDGSVIPVRRSRCSLGIPSAFVSDPVVIPKICVYDFSNGLHLYIFYRGHKMGKRKRPRFHLTEKHQLEQTTTLENDTPTAAATSGNPQGGSVSSARPDDGVLQAGPGSLSTLELAPPTSREKIDHDESDGNIHDDDDDDDDDGEDGMCWKRKVRPKVSTETLREHLAGASRPTTRCSSSELLLRLLPGLSVPDDMKQSFKNLRIELPTCQSNDTQSITAAATEEEAALLNLAVVPPSTVSPAAHQRLQSSWHLQQEVPLAAEYDDDECLSVLSLKPEPQLPSVAVTAPFQQLQASEERQPTHGPDLLSHSYHQQHHPPSHNDDDRTTTSVPIQTVFAGPARYTYLLNASLVVEVCTGSLDAADVPPVNTPTSASGVWHDESLGYHGEDPVSEKPWDDEATLPREDTTCPKTSLADEEANHTLGSFESVTLGEAHDVDTSTTTSTSMERQGMDKALPWTTTEGLSSLECDSEEKSLTTYRIVPKHVPEDDLQKKFSSQLQDETSPTKRTPVLSFGSCRIGFGNTELDIREIPADHVTARLTNITILAMKTEP